MRKTLETTFRQVIVVKDPLISVGIMIAEGAFHFRLIGPYKIDIGTRLSPGPYMVRMDGGRASLLDRGGGVILEDDAIRLVPTGPGGSRLVLRDVPLGRGFHWEQQRDLAFQGEFRFNPSDKGLIQVINRLPLEMYLKSVVESEMSSTAPTEFLKAHAVISRSWALRRVRRESPAVSSFVSPGDLAEEGTIIRWTSEEIHHGFDVCADDHCQRYYGIMTETGSAPQRAVHETRGEVLTYEGEICDTRYSKCCGGMTEDFRTAWEDRDVPYLRALPDNEDLPPDFRFPLSVEENARAWITGLPDAFCGIRNPEIMAEVLSPVDQSTPGFYRWIVVYSQEKISAIIRAKTGVDLGSIRDIVPLERGASGRIARLRIMGTGRTLTVGKELEIRRALSPSHLYSSAFTIQREPGRGGIPRRFRFVGAGWGHGVGLCQIGAAAMAVRGRTYHEILQHYFPGTRLSGKHGDSQNPPPDFGRP
jgi:SpoIID/LytB domain protein